MSERRDGAEGGGAPLHIALAAPMTLSMLQSWFHEPIASEGFAFPGTAELARRYRASGHRLTLVTVGFDVDRTQRYHGDGVELVVVPARGRGKGRAFTLFHRERVQIRQVLDQADPDVIHAHWTYEFGLAARAARAPAVVTVHDWAPAVARFNRHPYWYFRWAMQVMCLVRRGSLTAPSAYVAERVERLYRQRCVIVPNGVDLDEFAPGAGPASPHVLMLNVGFSHRKNVAAALEAWPSVLERVPSAVLVLGGPDYEEGGEADRWATSRGLRRNVRFDGPIDADRVPAWLRGGSLFLHTSLEESFGVVLVEAMASGLPLVVGADSGAAASVAAEGGVAVDITDPTVIGAAVARLLEDRESADAIAAAGVLVAAQYEVTAVVRRYEQLLRHAFERGGRRKV